VNRLYLIFVAVKIANPRPTTQVQNIKCDKPCIVVRNLAFHCKEEMIREAFEAHGTIANLRMAYKHDNGEKKFRGFCFIDFAEMKEAEAAIKMLNGKKIANRIVAVDYSLPKEKYDQVMAKETEEDDKEPAEEKMDEDQEEGSEQEEMDEDEEASGDEPMEEVEEQAEVERKPALKGDPGAMLFIRNLSFDSTEDDLRDLQVTLVI
jgi:RNA recognition motif-containing protein